MLQTVSFSSRNCLRTRIPNIYFINYKTASTARVTSPHAAPNKQPAILVEKDTNITLIGINRQRQRNSIDSETAKKLSDAFIEFEADTTSPVAVLYGIGGSFCAGYDLKELAGQTKCDSLDFLLRAEGAVGPTRRHLRKPVVCGISGFCVANGLELALLCDLRVMEHSAVLGFFNRHLGVPLTDGGTVRLAKAVGYARALDIISTGRRVTSSEALDIGLVNRVVATGTALGQAVCLAFSIAKYPMQSTQHDRNALYANVYGGKRFHASVQQEMESMSSDVLKEMREGVDKFKNRDVKVSRSSWYLKSKSIPDWEKAEIEHEIRYESEKARRNVKEKIT